MHHVNVDIDPNWVIAPVDGPLLTSLDTERQS
jgi:hypothetical protein